jgi:hypothetical protein
MLKFHGLKNVRFGLSRALEGGVWKTFHFGLSRGLGGYLGYLKNCSVLGLPEGLEGPPDPSQTTRTRSEKI